jgi:hypothetical protein
MSQRNNVYEIYVNLYDAILAEYDDKFINCKYVVEYLVKHFNVAEKIMEKQSKSPSINNYSETFFENEYYSPANEIVAKLTPNSINGGSYRDCWINSTKEQLDKMDRQLIEAYMEDLDEINSAPHKDKN